ncbi:MAG: MlaE family ABC transporter permease [Phycisphaerae bacterium]
MPKSATHNPIWLIGSQMIGTLSYLGGMAWLLIASLRETFRGFFLPGVKFPWRSFAEQIVRVGVRSTCIVFIIQLFLGVILALQMAPPLSEWGQEAMIANIIGEAGFRMLAPIITAIVISGYGGASMAAELGTMVVAEEIEAMEAIAMDPIRLLVVPRVWATFWSMLLLTVLADMMIALGGYIAARIVLDPPVWLKYWENMQAQLTKMDFYTGLIQAGVFGLLISLIACHSGLSVRGGAEGVGKATTRTVVYSIFAIVAAAVVFTILFYVYGI